ncbi:MAG TPA: helix-turn-helix domain-containing protein, partial [Longimicrobiales bacterium]|nr:helix-turn-helix domain-containing protein [Longimicrobiales bacterium]
LIMRDLDPDMRLADLRSGSSTRRILQVRKKVVVRACAAGYTGRAISRFLGISPNTVSRIKNAQ